MRLKKKNLKKLRQKKMQKAKNKKFTFKEEWYFTRQDIVSYTISSILYIILCVIKKLDLYSFVYSIFDCMLFYVSFWFMRINFDATYHADDWSICKFYTRLLLCLGVVLLWLLPIEYTLFNGILVAFICDLVLYVFAIKTKKDIYAMDKDELYNHCRSRGLGDDECKIAYFIVIERLKGKDLYNAINYSESQSKRIRKDILNKIK